MALNPDDYIAPSEEGGTPVENGGSGTTNSGSGTGTINSGTGTTNNSSVVEQISSKLNSIFRNADPETTLTLDPSKPLDTSGTTRYNAQTGKIESYNPISGKWNEVDVIKSFDKDVDLSQYTQKEIFDYMQSGLPIPAVNPNTGKKLGANTGDTPTQQKTKWWVWALVAVAVGGGLFAVWKLAKKRSEMKVKG